MICGGLNIVLQDTEPVEDKPKKNTRDEIIKGFQDSYAMSGESKNDIDLSEMVSSDEEKQNRQKTR